MPDSSLRKDGRLPSARRVKKMLTNLRESMREGFGESTDEEPTWNLFYNALALDFMDQADYEALANVLEAYAAGALKPREADK